MLVKCTILLCYEIIKFDMFHANTHIDSLQSGVSISLFNYDMMSIVSK